MQQKGIRGQTQNADVCMIGITRLDNGDRQICMLTNILGVCESTAGADDK